MSEASIRIHPECVYEFFEENSEQYIVCSRPGDEAFVFSGSALLIWQSLTREFQSHSHLLKSVATAVSLPLNSIEKDVSEFLQVLTQKSLLEVVQDSDDTTQS